MLDVIKEYLVGLGFRIDTPSLNQARNAMNQADTAISKFAGSAIGQFAAAGAAVTTFLVAVDTAIGKFLEKLAKTDLEMDKFARRMWTSKENAMAFKNSLDAMGASIEDLYLSPELMNNFLKLRQESFSLQTPDEYSTQMRYIRSIMFEFQRLKLEATYAFQWIGYYLIKYLGKPLEDFRLWLKDVNDKIIKGIPNWTKNVAQVASWFVRLGETAVKAGNEILNLFKQIPVEFKLMLGVLSAFGATQIPIMGPIIAFIMVLGALLLLLDDFYTYQNGGESQFEGLWKWVDKLQNSIMLTGLPNDFKRDLQDLGDTLKDLGGALGDTIKATGELLDELAKLAGFDNFGDLMEKTIIDVLKGLERILSSITSLIKTLVDLIRGDLNSALKDFGDVFGKLGEIPIPGTDMTVWDGLQSAGNGIKNGAVGSYNWAVGRIAGGVASAGNTVNNILNATINATDEKAEEIGTAVEDAWGNLTRSFQKGW